MIRHQTRRGTSSTIVALAVGLLVLGLAADPAMAAKSGWSEGDEVVVTGVVTDPAGVPLGGVTLELRGTRRAFSLRDFRIAKRGLRTASAVSDERGNFEIIWEWHPYYNRFDLLAGVDPTPRSEGDLQVLAEVDLSARMSHGHPVVAAVEIVDRTSVDALNAFVDTLDSEAKQRVYQEMGKPDKVRDTVLARQPETTWWYFEQGKVYRFDRGEIESVEDFEPIPEPES